MVSRIEIGHIPGRRFVDDAQEQEEGQGGKREGISHYRPDCASLFLSILRSRVRSRPKRRRRRRKRRKKTVRKIRRRRKRSRRRFLPFRQRMSAVSWFLLFGVNFMVRSELYSLANDNGAPPDAPPPTSLKKSSYGGGELTIRFGSFGDFQT